MAGSRRLGEIIEEYLAYRKPRLADTTWRNESLVMRRFSRDLPDVQVRNLTARHVAAWFYGHNGITSDHRTADGLRRPGVSPATFNYYRTRVAGLLRYMAANGLTRCDLLADVSPQTEYRRQRQQPTPSTLISLLDHASNSRDRAYIAVALNTASRASEIARLRLRDVDLKGGWLTFLIKKSRVEDLVPITGDLDPELRVWLSEYAGSIARQLGPEDFLFPAYTGSRYTWSANAAGQRIKSRTPGSWKPDTPLTHSERIVQAAMQAVGLPTRYEGTHTIRRAVARAFFDSLSNDLGYDHAIRTVSALLHHESSSTTERYLQLTSERRRRDQRLHGQPFLSAMIDTRNVTPLRIARR